MIFSKKQYFIYISLVVFLIILSYLFIDKDLAKYFIAHVETYEPIGDFISIFGESHWYIGTAILGYLFFKFIKNNTLYQQRFLFLLYANIFSGLMSLVLKHLFGRMRPWGLRNDGDEFTFLAFDNFDLGFVEKMKYHIATLADAPTTFTSFPSGHTTTVMTAATYLSLLFPKYIYLWFIVATVFASSRILANDHFLSDLFAGLLVGTISTIFIYSKMKGKI